MNRSLANSISKAYRRNPFVLAAMVLLLLASCPVKSGIKHLAGIPVNTEQSDTKGNYSFFGSALEKCVNGDATDKEIASSTSSQTNNLVPAVLHAATILLLATYTRRKEPQPSLYGSLKFTGRLPIFL